MKFRKRIEHQQRFDFASLLALFYERGFRTGLISDLYHQFKPSKNFWRGFHQWSFIRGQEADAARSGPWPTQAEIDYWVPRELGSDYNITPCLKPLEPPWCRSKRWSW